MAQPKIRMRCVRMIPVRVRGCPPTELERPSVMAARVKGPSAYQHSGRLLIGACNLTRAPGGGADRGSLIRWADTPAPSQEDPCERVSS